MTDDPRPERHDAIGVMAHGLQQMASSLERLTKENVELRLRVQELTELIAASTPP